MDLLDTHRLINVLRARQRSTDDLQLILDFLLSVKALENIMVGLSKAERNHLCRACHLAAYEAGQVVFLKGEKSDRFFVIVSGTVECVSIGLDDSVLYSATLSSMQILGEKGIMTDHPRSLTVRTLTAVYLISITAKDFKTYFEKGVFTLFGSRLAFLEVSIPAISAYTTAQKMNICYAMHKFTYKRNYLVLPPLGVSDFLYFVFEGECALTVFKNGYEKKFVKLAHGTCFGDESILIGRRSEYGVRVTSEFADFFGIRRSDVPFVLLRETISQLKYNCEMKQVSRNLLKRLASNRPSLTQQQSQCSAKRFPQASTQARKSLMNAVNRSFSNLSEAPRLQLSCSHNKALNRSITIKQKLLQMTTNPLRGSLGLKKRRAELSQTLPRTPLLRSQSRALTSVNVSKLDMTF